MKDYSLYEVMNMPDPNFPIKVYDIQSSKDGSLFPTHWHEHIELLYFVTGKAVVECSQKAYKAAPGDLVVVNMNELHQGESVSGPVRYYCIIIDISLLLGQSNERCQTKYISPIMQNLILFKNIINSQPEINTCIQDIIEEYYERKNGYELEITSLVFHLLVMLLRNHVDKYLTPEQYNLRSKNMERFNTVFKYIESNYTEKVTVASCAQMLNITGSHFCHLFKLITGKTLSSYVNYLRLKKAETLLKNTSLNITEIALATGFNDITYFTRLFSRQRRMSPSEYRREIAHM